MAVEAAGGVALPGAAGGDGVENKLVFEVVPLFAVGPAMFQHQVHPLLDHGRRAIEVEGVVPDDDLMCQQQFPFTGNVDIEIGILLVEIVDGDAFQVVKAGQQGPVGP